MLRVLALMSAFVVGTLPSWATELAPEPAPEPKVCCKTCRKGKACGDSCIARDKDCTVEAGCACDADDSPGDG